MGATRGFAPVRLACACGTRASDPRLRRSLLQLRRRGGRGEPHLLCVTHACNARCKTSPPAGVALSGVDASAPPRVLARARVAAGDATQGRLRGYPESIGARSVLSGAASLATWPMRTLHIAPPSRTV